MREPNPHSGRLALAGVIAVAIVSGVAGFIAGRQTDPAPHPAPTASETAAPPPVQSTGILSRAELIALARSAADEADVDGTRLRDAAGRRFDLALPFGCAGSGIAAGAAGFGWEYDAQNQRLRIRASAEQWPADDWLATEGLSPQGRLEGFWIERPWSTAATCKPGRTSLPPAADGDEDAVAPEHTLAVAWRADEEDQPERRAFETIQRMPADRFDPALGFVLRLTGRIALDQALPIRCAQPRGPGERPLCLVLVDPAEIRIEAPADAQVLATWQLGDARPTED